MKSIVFLLLFYCIGFDCNDEFYTCSYDMTKQSLCLTDGVFFFKEETAFTENIEVKGKYIIKHDTLIFNEGVKNISKHKFENELKLVKLNNRLYFLYEEVLSQLFFEKNNLKTDFCIWEN